MDFIFLLKKQVLTADTVFLTTTTQDFRLRCIAFNDSQHFHIIHGKLQTAVILTYGLNIIS